MCEYKANCKHYLAFVCKGEYLKKCDQKKALDVFNNLQGKMLKPITLEKSYKCKRCGFIVKSKLQYEHCPKCSANMQYFDPDDVKIKELKNPFGEV